MIENQLERIAVALEKLCVLVAETPKTESVKTREKKEPAKKETPAPLPVTQEPVAPTASVPAAATTQPSPAQPVTTPVQQPVAAPCAAPAPAVEPAAPITVEQLRAAIIEVQQKKGPAIAKKIVQETGNAPQVTKIEVAKYQMVMDACKAALL